jgi:hypothetical protein
MNFGSNTVTAARADTIGEMVAAYADKRAHGAVIRSDRQPNPAAQVEMALTQVRHRHHLAEAMAAHGGDPANGRDVGIHLRTVAH